MKHRLPEIRSLIFIIFCLIIQNARSGENEEKALPEDVAKLCADVRESLAKTGIIKLKYSILRSDVDLTAYAFMHQVESTTDFKTGRWKFVETISQSSPTGKVMNYYKKEIYVKNRKCNKRYLETKTDKETLKQGEIYKEEDSLVFFSDKKAY